MKGDSKEATTPGGDSFAARAVAGRRAALEQLASGSQQEQPRQARAVVYLRVASARQGDQGAIERQREGCRQIAERYGLTIVREYVDVGRPARLNQQIELLHLLDDLSQKRDVEAVIVWDYARLGRSMEQLEQVIHHVHACGAEIVTITGMEAAERFMREQLGRGEIERRSE